MVFENVVGHTVEDYADEFEVFWYEDAASGFGDVSGDVVKKLF